MVVPSTSLVKTDLGTLLVDYSGDLEMPDAQESWSSEPIFGLGSRLGLDDGFYGDPAYGSNFGQYYYSRWAKGFTKCVHLIAGTPGPLGAEAGEGHSTTRLRRWAL